MPGRQREEKEEDGILLSGKQDIKSLIWCIFSEHYSVVLCMLLHVSRCYHTMQNAKKDNTFWIKLIYWKNIRKVKKKKNGAIITWPITINVILFKSSMNKANAFTHSSQEASSQRSVCRPGRYQPAYDTTRRPRCHSQTYISTLPLPPAPDGPGNDCPLQRAEEGEQVTARHLQQYNELILKDVAWLV